MAVAPPAVNSEVRKTGRRFLGRYELIGELARGGMGTVFLARNAGEARFQRLFAIKVMHPHLADDKGFVDMLHDEARIAARIHHPNVVAVLDLGIQEDLHYIVMEYVEGPAFGTLLHRSGRQRPIELVLTIVIDALEGLHAAHTLKDDEGVDLQLVHRDVSPQNILVGVDGLGRITDFGIAKAETRITSTQPGMRKGKLAFMTPEQIKDDNDVDQRADVWAVGVVLWTALTGKNLFKGENDAVTIHNVLEKKVLPPSTQGWKPPAFLDHIVLRALERDPAKRFGSALDMAEALRSVAGAHGLLGSKHEVAKWVTSTFGEELALRRTTIKEVARRRLLDGEFTDASQITGLPALPRIASSTNSTLSSTTQLSPGSTGSFTGSIDSSLIAELPSPANPGLLGERNPFASRKSWLWIPIGLAVLVIGVVVLAMGSPSEESSKAVKARAAGRPAAAKAVGSGELAATPRTADLEATSAGDTSSPAKSLESTEQDASGKKPSRFSGRRFVRPASPKPAAETRDPKEPKEEPSSKPRPPPVPAATPAFEKNPYLRR